MLLCLDVSYILFYRINALKVWYKHREKEQPSEEVMLSDAFQQKLCKMIHTCIMKLCKTYKPSNILFAYDGHRNWRKKHDVQYKNTRSHQKAVLELFQRGILCMKEIDMLCCPTYHIEHESLEADDLIHYVTRKRNDINVVSTPLQTTIIANDYDYLPLLEYASTVHIINLKNKRLTLPDHLTGEQYLRMKIILGDKSDNITSVLKRCGPKTAAKLATDQTIFHEKIEKGSNAVQEKFKHNQSLIDNRLVPIVLKEWMKNHLHVLWENNEKKN